MRNRSHATRTASAALARIRDPRNMLVLPASLAGQTVYSVYKRDGAGLVHEVWLLTAEEYQKLGGTRLTGDPQGIQRFNELLNMIFLARATGILK